MRQVRRLLFAVAALALLPAGAAWADHLDPQKRFSAADQARAKSMLLRQSDFGPGARLNRTPSADTHLTCAALDESDLTLTGEAESSQWTAGLSFVSSASQVYESRADANTSWRRGEKGAGLACLREELRTEFSQLGVRLRSFRQIAFPTVAERTIAYRLVLSGTAQGQTVQLIVDLVALMQSRAHVALFFGSVFATPPRAEELRLARVLAKRATAAMRR
jgi:hypothetical protein